MRAAFLATEHRDFIFSRTPARLQGSVSVQSQKKGTRDQLSGLNSRMEINFYRRVQVKGQQPSTMHVALPSTLKHENFKIKIK